MNLKLEHSYGTIRKIGDWYVMYRDYEYISNEIDRDIIQGEYSVFDGRVKYSLGMEKKQCSENSFSVYHAFKDSEFDLDRLGMGLFLGHYLIKKMNSGGFFPHVWLADKSGGVVDTWVPEDTKITYVGVDILQIQDNNWANHPALKMLFDYMSDDSEVKKMAEKIREREMTSVTNVFRQLKSATSARS